jgi:hypothetical protein
VVVVVVTVLVSTHSASSICRLVVLRATASSDELQLVPARPVLILKSSIKALSGVARMEVLRDESPVKSGCGRVLVFVKDVLRRRDEGRKGGSILSIVQIFLSRIVDVWRSRRFAPLLLLNAFLTRDSARVRGTEITVMH